MAERASKGDAASYILPIFVALRGPRSFLCGKCLLVAVAAANARVGLTQGWPRLSTDTATFGIS